MSFLLGIIRNWKTTLTGLVMGAYGAHLVAGGQNDAGAAAIAGGIGLLSAKDATAAALTPSAGDLVGMAVQLAGTHITNANNAAVANGLDVATKIAAALQQQTPATFGNLSPVPPPNVPVV
jgi:hypothetical protein